MMAVAARPTLLGIVEPVLRLCDMQVYRVDKPEDVAETVEAYTMGSAYAEFQEKEKGSITVGKLADLVLLSDDIFTIDPLKIRDVKVLKTFVGGKLIYSAK